jgi:3',5'-cyclic-AMP phosphodiesterase
MKKGIAIFFVSFLVLSGLLTGGYFLVAKNLTGGSAQTGSNSSELEKSEDPSSFRGVLFGILKEVQAEAKNIATEVASPFSSKKAETSSVASSENSFSFAIIGDTQRFSAGNPNGNFQMAVKKISDAKPDLVLSTGDLTGSCESYTECLEKHNEWKKVDAPLLSKTYAAMGNHDNVDNKGVKAWQDAFDFPTNGPTGHSEMTYSFDFKNSHFVFLDSDEPDEHQVDESQRSWLDQDLAKNTKENVFVIFHEPAFPVSSKIGESLDTQASQRNALWQILDKYNVTAVFNGHEHIVSRRKIDSSVFPSAKNSIYQFVFGNTDSFDHDLPQPGVAEYANQDQGRHGLVKVNGKEITVETYGPDGKIINTFTFSK